jgi:hypothetical protein
MRNTHAEIEEAIGHCLWEEIKAPQMFDQLQLPQSGAGS